MASTNPQVKNYAFKHGIYPPVPESDNSSSESEEEEDMDDEEDVRESEDEESAMEPAATVEDKITDASLPTEQQLQEEARASEGGSLGAPDVDEEALLPPLATALAYHEDSTEVVCQLPFGAQGSPVPILGNHMAR